MSLQLYNTLTKKKEEFIPREDGNVSMYVCGPTVYDAGHLGHGRSAVAFDVLRRYLKSQGFNVTMVSNYTDIDDKMIDRARDESVSVPELAERIIPMYVRDFGKLRILPADIHPRATDFIDAMIALIEELSYKGAAYKLSDGVYFDVKTYRAYGELSGQNLDELEAGKRVELHEEKRNPQDFVLWKFEKPGEPSWNSPWGKGRPGWHIECSAMARELLGQPVDIHGGGLDLTFPHHECERAQSEVAYGEPFVRYWAHNGFVNINKEKMSKSLGNFVTLDQIFQQYPGRVVRLMYLQTHYRSPLDFSESLLTQAQAALERVDQFMRMMDIYVPGETAIDHSKEISVFERDFVTSMDRDLDVPGGLGVVFSLINFGFDSIKGRELSLVDVHTIKELLRSFDTVLAVLQSDEKPLDDMDIVLLRQREEARKKRDFVQADKVRDSLFERGIVIEDTPFGALWKRVSS